MKGTTACFSNTSTKWRVFDLADLPTGERSCVLLRVGRLCTRRGHSDRAGWNDDSREPRRCRLDLLAIAYLSSLTRGSGLQEYRVQGHFSCMHMFLVEAGRLFELYITHQ